VTQRMAHGVGYPDLEKAYLAGLIHDIGFLVNSVLYTLKLQECLKHSATNGCPLHVSEQEILVSHMRTPGACFAGVGPFRRAGGSCRLSSPGRISVNCRPLVCLVHLGDLLCRVRNLGYGYNEVLAVALAEDTAWKHLVPAYPALAEVDLVRFTLDIDGSMDQIAALVDSVFAPSQQAVAKGI